MIKLPKKEVKKSIVVVGAGGTGGWLAPMLSKIVDDTDVVYIDADIVETKNITRQNFYEEDIMKSKAEVMGDRYGFGYIKEYITDPNIFNEIFDDNVELPIIIGCVDNNASRKVIHDYFQTKDNIIWLDSGNAERHGQIYVAYKENGNIVYNSPIALDEAFQNFDGDQRRPDQISCAEHSESAPQNVTANTTAALMLFNILNIVMEGGALFHNLYEFNTKLMSFTKNER